MERISLTDRRGESTESIQPYRIVPALLSVEDFVGRPRTGTTEQRASCRVTSLRGVVHRWDLPGTVPRWSQEKFGGVSIDQRRSAMSRAPTPQISMLVTCRKYLSNFDILPLRSSQLTFTVPLVFGLYQHRGTCGPIVPERRDNSDQHDFRR